MECATALPWLKRRSRSERSVSLVSIQTRVFGEGAIDGFLPGLTTDKVDKPVKLPSNHKEMPHSLLYQLVFYRYRKRSFLAFTVRTEQGIKRIQIHTKTVTQ